MKKKLAIITTHPVQYNAPLFSLLQGRGNIDIHVFYTWGEEAKDSKYDPGFAADVQWDIPLLQGYPFSFVENKAKRKGSDHFWGINNPGIINQVIAFKPDAILVYGWSFKSHFDVLRYFKKRVPVLFRGDSTMLDAKRSFKSLARKIFLKWVYRHIDMAFYTGKSNYAYFKAAGLANRQLVFVPHAVDNGRFVERLLTNPGADPSFRSSLNIDATDFVFLFSGKLEIKKSPELLVQAFCESGFGKNVHLVLAGSGPLGKSLGSQYAHHPQIHFTGFVNQSLVPALYYCADVVVLPSAGPGESWGLAINEAMACSRPVIVSDRCGCAADLVQDNVNGYVFMSGNKADLQAKMQRIYGMGKNIIEMGKASLKIINEYSLEKAAAGIENTVMNIAPK